MISKESTVLVKPDQAKGLRQVCMPVSWDRCSKFNLPFSLRVKYFKCKVSDEQIDH